MARKAVAQGLYENIITQLLVLHQNKESFFC